MPSSAGPVMLEEVHGLMGRGKWVVVEKAKVEGGRRGRREVGEEGGVGCQGEEDDSLKGLVIGWTVLPRVERSDQPVFQCIVYFFSFF